MRPEEAALLGALRQELEASLKSWAGRLESWLASSELESIIDQSAERLGVSLGPVFSYGDRPNFIQSESAERTYFKALDLFHHARERASGLGELASVLAGQLVARWPILGRVSLPVARTLRVGGELAGWIVVLNGVAYVLLVSGGRKILSRFG